MFNLKIIHIFAVLIILMIKNSNCSHFRGGLITWRPLNSSADPINNKIDIYITTRFYWRLDYNADTRCNQNTILNNGLIGEDGFIECDVGCESPRLGLLSTKVACTDFSNIDNWSGGEKTTQVSLPDSNKIEAAYSSSAWIDLNNGGGDWEVRVKLGLKKRNDTNKINSSPIASMSPVIKINSACNTTLEIPVEDRDGDIIKCRWAGPRECGGVCSAPSISFLDSDKCILYIKPSKLGYYGVTIQIEDFPNENVIDLSKPFSSVPLQFLIFAEKRNENCSSPALIYFHEDTAQDKSCIGIPFNSMYTDKIIVYSESEVIEITTQSPSGLIKSSISSYGEKLENLWYVNVTWKPLNSQQGPQLFCFKATNKLGQLTNEVCISLVVGVNPATFFEPTPTNLIYPNQTEFRIFSDKPIFSSLRVSKIKIFDSQNILVEKILTNSTKIIIKNNNSLIINTNHQFIEKSTYYILLDRGIAISNEFCGIESNAITDTNFWKFRVRDITPPTVQFQSNPRTSNSSVNITWTVDEEVIFRCTLNTPTNIILVNCSLFVELNNLDEGWHVLEVEVEDLEGNKAPTLQHSWYVDRTPPITELSSVPPKFSNKKQTSFGYRCINEIFPCNFFCSLDLLTSQKCLSTSSYNTEQEKSYNFSVYAVDEAANIGNPVSFSFIIDLTPPKISQLPTMTIECSDSISPNVTGYPTVDDNIDENPTVYYKDEPQEKSCSIIRTWFAQDSAGNIAKMNQTISLINSDDPEVTGKNEIIVACDNLNEITSNLIKNSFNVTQKCKSKLFISYNDSQAINKCGISVTRYWSVKDSCSINSVIFIQTIRVLNPDKPLTPFNGEINVDIYKTLQWYQYPKTKQYRVYIWRDKSSSSTSNFSLTSNNIYKFLPFYPPNTKLFWKLEYLQSDNTDIIPSPVWAFQTRSYADLTLNDIKVPFLSFSGTKIEISYSVINIGNTSTSTNSWVDSLYISKVTDFGSSTLVSSQRQYRILNEKDGYSNSLSLQLREDQIGTFYFYVNIDSSRVVNDFDFSNNIKLASQPLEVKLTPPPNLIIDSLVIPSQTFSAQQLQITFVVKNIGLGPTKATKWSDIVILGGKTNTTLKIIPHEGILLSGESYKVQAIAMMPHAIYGNFSIIIKTDYYDQVFEFNNKDDNYKQQFIEVIVSPPPDLVVDSINSDYLKYSTNDLVNVNYTVKNVGPGETYESYWSDLIELTNIETKLVYKRLSINNYVKLASNEFYTKLFNFKIDQEIKKGDYNISVLTDYKDNVFEYIWKDNNKNWLKITIDESYPDLEIINAVFEVQKSNKSGNTLKLIYQVKNKGKGTTGQHKWIDRVFLSYANSTQFSYNNNPFIDLTNNEEIKPNETKNISTNIQIPNSFYADDVYLIINVNQANSLIEISNQNNYLVTKLKLEKFYSLLSIEKVQFNIVDGALLIYWSIKNKGNIEISSKSWFDRIVIKSLEPNSYSSNYDIQINKVIQPNENYNMNKSITLPMNLYGKLNISLTCDFYSYINNDYSITINYNKTFSSIVNKPIPLVPDLVVKSLDCGLRLNNSMRYISCKWVVINSDHPMSKKSDWLDTIQLISSDNSINLVSQEVSFQQSYMLSKYEGYETSKYFILNSNLNKNFKVKIYIDSKNQIFELNKVNNQYELDKIFNLFEFGENFTSQPQLFVNEPIINTNKIETGIPFMLQYNTSSLGKSNLSYTYWTDAIYLTIFEYKDKQSIMSNGLRLTTIKQMNSIDLNSFFQTNINVTLPSDLLINKYNFLSLVVDINNVFEKMDQNNLFYNLKLKNNNLIQIIEGPKADLKLAEINIGIIRNYSGGEVVSLVYKVENIGNGSTSMSQDFYWYDAIYLSIDAFIDPFDVKLSSIKINKNLNKNESYSNKLNLTLPLDLDSANYYLIFSIDNTKLIDDYDFKNNIDHVIIFIKQTISANLAVLEINTNKNDYNYEEKVDTNWTVINNGSQSVSGIKCDSVYLSKDIKWDIDDIELDKPDCNSISYLPYENKTKYDYKKIFKLPYVSEGEYYALVKIRSNIKQISLNNNEKSTSNKINIKLSYLYIDRNNSILIETNKYKVFKIEISTNESIYLDDQTLVINLNSNESTSIHTLFVKHNIPPKQSDFDFISEPMQEINQNAQIVINSIKSGSDYYLGILNSDILNSDNNREINIFVDVRIAKFEIFDVSPKHVLENYNTTLKIKGTKFGTSLNAYLESDSIRIESIRIQRASSEIVFTTFLVKNLNINSFNLTLIDLDTNQTVYYKSIIELKMDGLPGTLKIKINSPESSIRINENVLWSLLIENIGESDINSPLLLISTDGNSNVTMLANDMNLNKHDRYFLLYALNQLGSFDIIQAKSFLKFDFQSKPSLNFLGRSEFKIHLVNKLDYKEFETNNLKQETKPYSVSESVWNIVWTNREKLFNLETNYYDSMLNLVKCFASRKKYIYSPIDLIQYQLDYSNNRQHGSNFYLNSINDLAEDFDLTRQYSNLITNRRKKGVFGYGWYNNLLDLKIIQLNSEFIVINIQNEENILTKADKNEYINNLYKIYIDSNYINLIDNNIINSLPIIYQFESTSPYKLIKLTNFDWNDSIDIIYNNLNQVQQIKFNNSNKQIQFDYNPKSTITLIKFFSENNLLNQISYKYDETNQYLSRVSYDFDKNLIRYAYDYDGDLLRILNDNTGDYIQFSYDQSSKFLLSMASYDISKNLLKKTDYQYDLCELNIKYQPENRLVSHSFNEKFQLIQFEMDEVKLNLVNFNNDLNMNSLYLNDNELIFRNNFNEKTNSFEQIDANNNKRTLFFDKNSNLIKIIDSNYNIIEINYSEKDNHVKDIIYPDKKQLNIFYLQNDQIDNKVLIDKIRNRDQSEISFKYDSLNRIQSKYVNNEILAEYSYSQDNQNQIEKISNLDGETIIEYDKNGLPTKVIYSDSNFIKYEYDSQMRRISTETNLNYYIKYEYNQFDQLVNCRDGNTNEKLIEYKYDQYGRLIRMTNSDGSRVQYDYYEGKTSHYVKKIQSYFSTNETFKSIEYIYNQKGQRTKMIIDNVDFYTYRYDSIGQIIYYQREFNNKSESSIYNYDTNFNRKQVSNNGTNSIYLTNSLNQYVQIESRKLEYDDLGNLINDGVHTYKYNSESKCVQIDDCKLKYDHFNNINSIECSNGKTTRLIVDPFGFHGFDVISEITTTSNSTNTNQEIIHYLNSFRNGLFGMRKNDQLYNYLFDIDSNVISLFKNNIIYNDYSYDPFGKVISSSENLKNRFKFSAKYGIFELSTNIYLNRARLYDSFSSRFLSMDPSGIMTSSYNLYVYCNNNPLDYKDTDGKIVLPFLVAGSIIGSITNTAVYGLTVAAGLESFSLGGLTGAALNGAITGAGVTGGAIIGGPLGLGATFGVGAIAGSGSTLISNAIDNKPSTVSSIAFNGLLNGVGALFPTTMLGYQGQGATAFGKIPTKLNTLLGLNKKYKATAKSLWKTLSCGNIIGYGIGLLGNGIKDWIASHDPNDIIGPDSYGDRNFVSRNELFIYKIRFENDENATAPAQKVFIKYNPSEYLDIKTFRLLSFGYDDYVYEYNYPSSFSQMMLDYPKDTTFKIRFQAGINIISSEITWLFESIDILTGLPPKNPEIGFLPPNNGTSGQGYVMFSLNVKKDTTHMSQIDAEADIVFDMNEPIITPKIFHTIDDKPPFIELYPNTDLISQGQFAINLIKSDNGSGVESVDIYEYDKNNNSLLFLLNTIEDLAILPLSERRNYVLTAIGRDFAGNIQNVNDIFKLNLNFDYKIDCPNNCSQNGICNYDTGVCKCDTDYILTDCSFFYDGNDENYFDFKVFISNYNDKSFDLNFDFKSIYNFDDVKLIISGFPIETNFSSNYSLDDNQSLVVNSFESLNVNLPSQYFGDIKLNIELQLKYLLIEFTATRKINFFVSNSNQSFVALFLITNIECLSNDESELSFVKIDYSYDLIGNENNQSNITISLDLISLNENFNFTVLNDFNNKNGSIELTFSDLNIFLTIQANISHENDDNEISVDRAISLGNCNKLINNQTTSTSSLITNGNEISTDKDGSSSIFTSTNTESSDLNTLYFTNEEITSTSKLTTINLNSTTNLNDGKKGSSNKTLIIVSSISAVVILIGSITSIYFFKKKKKLKSTLNQFEMNRFSEKF